MFHSSYESNLCGGFIPAIFQAFFNRRNQGGSHKAGQAEGHSEPAHHPVDARYYSVVDEPQLS